MPVITITADYSAQSGGGVKAEHSLVFGTFFGTANRAAARFPLTSAPAGEPTKVELIVEVYFPVGTANGTHYARGYNTNGQSDPSGDAASTLFNRALGTIYLTTTLFGNSAGLKTIDISGATLFADIAAAKTAVNRFSLGFTQFNEVGSSNQTALRPDNDGTNPPKLRLTYPETATLPFFWSLV